MDKINGENTGLISRSIAGALCIFATREEGVVEYFKNLDGFRIEEDGTIRAIQFAGDRWIPIVLEGYKLTAMRSIRDHEHLMSSYSINFCFDSSLSRVLGIRITEETPHEVIMATHYTFGTPDYPKGIHKKIHYNAGLKTLADILSICKMELDYFNSRGMEIPDIFDTINDLDVFVA